MIVDRRGARNRNAQLGRHGAILLPAQDDEVRRRVEPGQVPQQVPNVGADSVVTPLTGIYRDPHAS